MAARLFGNDKENIKSKKEHKSQTSKQKTEERLATRTVCWLNRSVRTTFDNTR